MVAKRVPQCCRNRRFFENVCGGTDLEGLWFNRAFVVARFEKRGVRESYNVDRMRCRDCQVVASRRDGESCDWEWNRDSEGAICRRHALLQVDQVCPSDFVSDSDKDFR